MSRSGIARNITYCLTASIIAAQLIGGACRKAEPEEPKPVVPVQTAQVQRGPIDRVVRAEAILHPFDQASFVPKISAPVRAFHIKRGDHVRQGQLLATLENRDLAAAALEAKGNYDQAEASYRSTTAASLPEEVAKAQADVQSTKETLEAVQKVLESRKSLFDQGALPRKQLDEASVAFIQARSQYEVAVRHLESLQKVGKEEQVRAAQAQVEAAKGRRDAAEAQLGYSEITSPIDGVITDRPLYAGEMASTGSPLLTVMDVSRIIARANVPTNQIQYVKPGDAATITTMDPPLTLQGKVTVVSPALDPNSTTAEVWVLAPNPGERLRPGLSVQVAIVAESIPDAIVIPSAALLPSQEETSQTVLVAGPDGKAHERKIQTGVREKNLVQVLNGLKPGEQVITVGGFGLEDNTEVRIENNESTEKSGKHE